MKTSEEPEEAEAPEEPEEPEEVAEVTWLRARRGVANCSDMTDRRR